VLLLGAAVGHVFITDDTASREMTAALRFCSCTFVKRNRRGKRREAVNRTQNERPHGTITTRCRTSSGTAPTPSFDDVRTTSGKGGALSRCGYGLRGGVFVRGPWNFGAVWLSEPDIGFSGAAGVRLPIAATAAAAAGAAAGAAEEEGARGGRAGVLEMPRSSRRRSQNDCDCRAPAVGGDCTGTGPGASVGVGEGTLDFIGPATVAGTAVGAGAGTFAGAGAGAGAVGLDNASAAAAGCGDGMLSIGAVKNRGGV
jgi:hypothetical protein